MSALRLHDVRALMPNYGGYRDQRRPGPVTGIAVHHSATANHVTGVSTDTAATIFSYHVEVRGWSHGGYHYVIRPNGLVEYALDETIPGFHAGFVDPDDTSHLECGQFWNNHLLAVCLLGWFDADRKVAGGATAIPNRFTSPTRAQRDATVTLLTDLARRHGLDAASIKGHRELAGCHTVCPGRNVDMDDLRRVVAAQLLVPR